MISILSQNLLEFDDIALSKTKYFNLQNFTKFMQDICCVDKIRIIFEINLGRSDLSLDGKNMHIHDLSVCLISHLSSDLNQSISRQVDKAGPLRESESAPLCNPLTFSPLPKRSDTRDVSSPRQDFFRGNNLRGNDHRAAIYVTTKNHLNI